MSDSAKVIEQLLDKLEKDAIEINLPSGKTYKIMNYISGNALEKYGAAIERKKSSKSAFYSLLCELAVGENKIKEEELLLLQEQEIISLGYQLLEKDEELIETYNSITDAEDFFERFKKTWEIYNQKQKKAIQEFLPVHPVLSLGRMAAKISPILNCGMLENLRTVHRFLNFPVAKRAFETGKMVEKMVPEIQIAQSLGQLARTIPSAESHLSILNIAKNFNVAQEIANRNNWGRIDSLVERPDLFPYRPIFTEITNSYINLLKSIPNTKVFKFLPEILELSSVEYFNDVSLTEFLHNEEIDEQDKFTKIKRDQYSITEKALIPLLESIDQDLVVRWQGALHVFDDPSNPEQVRHFTISVRELLNELIHELAPDKNIENWTQSPKHFNKGRPTRRARLLYITRNINHEPLHKYFEKNIQGILDLYDDLSGKVHGSNGKVTQQQIDAIKIKAQHSIYFLLSIRDYNNKMH